MNFAKSLVLAMPLAVLVPTPSFAHYPFPSRQEERQKASRIEQAVEAETQAAVRTLTGLLGDENPRVQTAAMLGTMRLANTSLDFTDAVASAGGLKDSEHAFVSAAAETATILLDRQFDADWGTKTEAAAQLAQKGLAWRIAVSAMALIKDQEQLASGSSRCSGSKQPRNSSQNGSRSSLMRRAAVSCVSWPPGTRRSGVPWLRR